MARLVKALENSSLFSSTSNKYKLSSVTRLFLAPIDWCTENVPVVSMLAVVVMNACSLAAMVAVAYFTPIIFLDMFFGAAFMMGILAATSFVVASTALGLTCALMEAAVLAISTKVSNWLAKKPSVQQSNDDKQNTPLLDENIGKKACISEFKQLEKRPSIVFSNASNGLNERLVPRQQLQQAPVAAAAASPQP